MPVTNEIVREGEVHVRLTIYNLRRVHGGDIHLGELVVVRAVDAVQPCVVRCRVAPNSRRSLEKLMNVGTKAVHNCEVRSDVDSGVAEHIQVGVATGGFKQREAAVQVNDRYIGNVVIDNTVGAELQREAAVWRQLRWNSAVDVAQVGDDHWVHQPTVAARDGALQLWEKRPASDWDLPGAERNIKVLDGGAVVAWADGEVVVAPHNRNVHRRREGNGGVALHSRPNGLQVHLDRFPGVLGGDVNGEVLERHNLAASERWRDSVASDIHSAVVRRERPRVQRWDVGDLV